MHSDASRGLVVTVLLLLAGCTPGLYLPSAKDTSATASLQELMDGRALYIGKCSGCHNLYVPARFSESVWRGNIDRMQGRAHIDESQKSLIVKYLLAGREDQARKH